MDFELNPEFISHSDLVFDIRNQFPVCGSTIAKSRNHIKVIEHNGIRFCVKSFQRLPFFRRLIYSLVRPTKAKRSYRYALRLLSMDIGTPCPVAYIDHYSTWGLLTDSYYISLYLDYDYTLADVFTQSLQSNSFALQAFAQFAWRGLHAKGVYHNDLTVNNVLIKQRGAEELSFFLIDLNRISFCTFISLGKGLKNFERLEASSPQLTLLGYEYATLRGGNPNWDALMLGLIRVRYLFYRTARRRIKARLLKVF